MRVGTLRLLSAAITNREKEVGHELDDDEVREVAAKEVKKRTEAIEAFAGAGRDELAEKESAERDVLRPYAPAQLDEAAVVAIVDEVDRRHRRDRARRHGEGHGPGRWAG